MTIDYKALTERIQEAINAQPLTVPEVAMINKDDLRTVVSLLNEMAERSLLHPAPLSGDTDALDAIYEAWEAEPSERRSGMHLMRAVAKEAERRAAGNKCHQPVSEPTEALTDDDILALWSGGSVGITRPVLGSQKVLFFARALLARVSGANDEARLLGDLLAVIHRDGGHYTDRVGVEASAEEAKRIFFSLRDREPTEAQRELTAEEVGVLDRSLRRSVTVVARGRHEPTEAQIEWPARADEGMLRAMIGWRECDEREGLSGEAAMFDRAYHALYSHMRNRAALAAKESK